MRRYFLAVPVSGVAARRLSRLARATSQDAARIAHLEDLHITLCYFGATRDGVIRRIVNSIRADRLARAFDARIGGVGPFAASPRNSKV